MGACAGGRGAGADETKLVPSRQILIGRGEEAGGGGGSGAGADETYIVPSRQILADSFFGITQIETRGLKLVLSKP